MFTFEDQEIVRKAFTIAMERTLARYVDPVNRNVVQTFLIETAHLRNPITTMSNEGIDDLVRQIFVNQTLIEFVLALSFSFYTVWGETGSKLSQLIESMVSGLAIESGRGSLIPPELSARYRSAESVELVLQANTWLIPLFLAMVYYRESDRTQK